jgi:RNase P subunit RPR2
MRRRPCRSCGRPTALGELVETHVYAGQTVRPGWWVSADRVIWLCRRCATPLRKPARSDLRERR